MTGKTHIAIGSAAAVTIFPMLGIDTSASLILGAVLGSLIPDLEHPKAMLNQRILPFKNKATLMFLFSIIGISINIVGLSKLNGVMIATGIFIIFAGISSHRSFTHSLLGVKALILICYLMNY